MHLNDSVTVKTVSGSFLFAVGKLEESEGYNYFFDVFFVVRIEIDQFLCLRDLIYLV